MADETELPVVLKLFAQKTSSVNSVLQETKKGFNDLAGEVTSVAKSAALISGSFTVALGGVVAAAVNVAGQFESLQAKLTSTLGDASVAARAFQQAVELAAGTPFDVQGVVQAQVQITAFGQSAQRVLPLAANLAAAFGERIQDVGQILGKAFSGSLEGFESLRSRLGISNILLQKFGAELTKTGGISVNTAESLRKAQDALEKIIQTRFGDATARQSQTLFGALSNLSDAIQRAGAAFGTTLIPFVTATTRVLTGVIEKFERLSPSTRQFIAVAALAATGLGALATAALALTAALTAGLGTLVSFAGALGAVGGAATGAAATASGLGTMAAAVSGVGSALSGAATGAVAFLGPVGAITLLLGGAAAIAIQSYTSSVQAADQAVVNEARSLTESRNAFRDYLDVIDKVTNSQGRLITSSGSVGQLAGALQAAFANISPIQFLDATTQAGVSLEGLQQKMEVFKGKSEDLKARLDILSTGLAAIVQKENSPLGAFTPENEAAMKAVNDLLGTTYATSEQVSAALQSAQFHLTGFTKAGLEVKTLADRFQEFNPILSRLTEGSQRFQDYLKFANKITEVEGLRTTMADLDAQIVKTEADAKALGAPIGDAAALTRRLLEAGPAEATAIKALLPLYEAKAENQRKQEADAKNKLSERIRAEEVGLERNKILFGENKRAEVAKYQELLGLVQANSQEELSLLGKIATAKQSLAREEVARVKSSLTDLVGTSNSGLEALRSTGEATAASTAQALQGVIRQLEMWGEKNALLIRQNPQLAQEFRNTLAGFQTRLNTAQLDIPREKLREAIAAAKEFGTEAVTNVQKLGAASQARESLEKLAASGSIVANREKLTLQAEINNYKKQELTLQQAIVKEQDAQNRLTAGLKRDGLAQEIELLKQQQTIQGKSPFLANQIADKEKQLLAERVQAIRDQEQQEIDAGATKAQAQERTQLRITQLQNEEVLKRISAEQNATSAYSAELQKRQAEEERFRQQRQGGPNSPLISLGELSATSGFLGNFSLGGFNQDLSGGRRFGGGQPDQRQLLRVRQTVANDLRQGEVLAGRGGPGGSFSQGINERERLARQAEGGVQSGGGDTYQSVIINGEKRDKPALMALMKEAIKELGNDNQLRGA